MLRPSGLENSFFFLKQKYKTFLLGMAPPDVFLLFFFLFLLFFLLKPLFHSSSSFTPFHPLLNVYTRGNKFCETFRSSFIILLTFFFIFICLYSFLLPTVCLPSLSSLPTPVLPSLVLWCTLKNKKVSCRETQFSLFVSFVFLFPLLFSFLIHFYFT